MIRRIEFVSIVSRGFDDSYDIFEPDHTPRPTMSAVSSVAGDGIAGRVSWCRAYSLTF